MANPPKSLNLLLLVLSFSLTLFRSSSESDSDRVSELQSIQFGSKSGLIRLDDRSITRFLGPKTTPRSYSLIIFFDAQHLHDKPDLHLKDLHSEFALTSSSFISNSKDSASSSKLFFCDLEFKDSQSTFAQFGVNSLPHIRILTGQTKSLKDSVKMSQGDLSRLSESLSEFVQENTGINMGPIQRPPIFSKLQLGIFGMGLLCLAPFSIRKIIKGDTLLHDSRIWLAMSLFVYFFSVSGSMHNIIRKMPMFLTDREDPSKLVFFYQGSGMQLGAEGFSVGFLYTIVGLLLAFLTHFLVRVKSVTAQRAIMMLALVLSFWAVGKVVHLDNWKTGYGIHPYWPSSWK